MHARYLGSCARSGTPLPDDHGPLSKVVPSQAIATANEEVKAAVDAEPGQKRTRGPYSVFSPEEKAEIRKRASQHGIAAAIRHFAMKGFRFSDVKESSVRTWKKKYLSVVKAEKDGSTCRITKLPSARRGRPLLLGRFLDTQVQMYLQLRENGAVVNSAIALACARGVVKIYESFVSGERWAPCAYKRLGKRFATPDGFRQEKCLSGVACRRGSPFWKCLSNDAPRIHTTATRMTKNRFHFLN